MERDSSFVMLMGMLQTKWNHYDAEEKEIITKVEILVKVRRCATQVFLLAQFCTVVWPLPAPSLPRGRYEESKCLDLSRFDTASGGGDRGQWSEGD